VDLQFLPVLTGFDQRKAKKYGITVPGLFPRCVEGSVSALD
jgi:hypothetical protein